MTAVRLIRSALAEHTQWWDAIGDAIEGDVKNAVAATACASASSVGMAVALAWVAREYPDRADELAALMRDVIDNGGDPDDLLAGYWPRDSGEVA